MFDRFTEAARRVVVLAQDEARVDGAERIRSEHLLLGLLQAPRSPASALLAARGVDEAAVRAGLAGTTPTGSDDREALAALGIDLDAVRRHAEESFGPGALEGTRAAGRARAPRRDRNIAFGADAKEVLQVAVGAAARHRSGHIGGEHMLLGLVADGTGRARGLLAARGVTPEAVREVVAARDPGAGAPPAP